MIDSGGTNSASMAMRRGGRERSSARNDDDGLPVFTMFENVKNRYGGKASQGMYHGWITKCKHPLYDILQYDDKKTDQPDYSYNVHASMIERLPFSQQGPPSTELLTKVIKRSGNGEESEEEEVTNVANPDTV